MNEEIPSRRTMLRGALAVGCAWWMPVVLSGCDSKKGATPSYGAPTGSPVNNANAAAAGKAPQASVQYQTKPKGEQKCGQCQHFIAGSNSCKLVEGTISPDGWCSLFAKKA